MDISNSTSVPGDADRDFPVVDEILQRGSVSDRPTEAAQHQVQTGSRRRLDKMNQRLCLNSHIVKLLMCLINNEKEVV